MFPKAKNNKFVPVQHIALKSVITRALFNATIYKWVKICTCSKSKKWERSCQSSQIFLYLSQVTSTKLNFFQPMLLKCKICRNRRPSMKAICLWPKIKQLLALLAFFYFKSSEFLYQYQKVYILSIPNQIAENIKGTVMPIK